MEYFEDFSGFAGQAMTARGWTAVGSPEGGFTDGMGGLRITESSEACALIARDTGSTSNYAESVIGAGMLEAGRTSTMAGICAVKTPTVSSGGNKNCFTVDYSIGYKSLFVRQGPDPIGSFGVQLVAGDVVRLEAKMDLDNESVNITLLVNGVKRAGPFNSVQFLTQTGAGFVPRSAQPADNMLDSVKVGNLVLPPPDTTKPTLSSPTVYAVGSFKAVGGVSSSEYALAWAALTTTATKPTPEALKAGVGFAAVHSGGVVAGVNAEHFLFAGLQPSTQYWMHVSANDPTGLAADVVTSAPFTTPHLGELGSKIRAQTGSGVSGPGLLYALAAGKPNVTFELDVKSWPVEGVLDWQPNGAFSYSGPEGTIIFTVREDGGQASTHAAVLSLGGSPPAPTAATLSNLTVIGNSSTNTVTGSFNSDKPGTMCAVLTNSATPPANLKTAPGVIQRVNKAALEGANTVNLTTTFSDNTVYLHVQVETQDNPPLASAVLTSQGLLLTAPPPATTTRCRIRLYTEKILPAASFNNLHWWWYDKAVPNLLTDLPVCGGLAGVTDAEGWFDVILTNSTLLKDQIGTLVVLKTDGLPGSQTNRAMVKPVQVS